jgi:hypothetical protein
MSQSERRQTARMNLSMPVRVQGHDTAGVGWEEMASVRDASPSGVALALRHAITRGQVLLLTLPLPKRFRQYDLADASYRIYGLVRGVKQEAGLARVGVMFLGRHAPRGYERNPGGLFLLPTDAPPAPTERRRTPRLDVFVNLRIRRLREDANDPREEQTIAENIGKGGARVLTSLDVVKGEILEVREVGGTFRARAEVRNVYVGQDRIPRLNLCFLDAEAPAHLVQHS